MSIAQERGTPDWGIQATNLSAVGIDPALSAEFSALGFARIDGKGRPFIFDDFSNGIGAYATVLSGAAAQVQSYGGYGYVGAQCARLDPGSSGAGKASIKRLISFPPSNRLGIEVAFGIFSFVPPLISFSIQCAPLNKAGFLQYASSDAQWSIKSGGVSQLIGGIRQSSSWNFAKLVIDFSTGKYVRAVTTSISAPPTVTDLSAFALDGAPDLGFTLHVEADGVGASEFLDVGYLLFTVDEP